MCKTWLKTLSGQLTAADTERSSDLTKLTKCPNRNLFSGLLSLVYGFVCVCMWGCVYAYMHTLCSIIQTLHYIETQCVLIRHYVAKKKIKQKLHRAKKKASMPEKSVFKAKKQNKVCREELREIKLKSKVDAVQWSDEEWGDDEMWCRKYLYLKDKVCCSGLIILGFEEISLQKPVYRITAMSAVEWVHI